jgi:hypothetical protein
MKDQHQMTNEKVSFAFLVGIWIGSSMLFYIRIYGRFISPASLYDKCISKAVNYMVVKYCEQI